MEETITNTHNWPRITVVTPSYNQGMFLKETIESVLGQSYPNLEYMIIDGGSTDNSVEIIRQYEGYLAYWVSEPDRGLAHAINKGFDRATGDILAWLNSDDTYEPDTLHTVAGVFMQNKMVNVVFGDCNFIDAKGKILNLYKGIDYPFERKLKYWWSWDVPQPTVFVRKELAVEVGPLDESIKRPVDYDWFLRMAENHQFHHISRVLANYRLHSDSFTGDWDASRDVFHRENWLISRRYWGSPTSTRFWRLLLSYGLYNILKPFLKWFYLALHALGKILRDKRI